MPAPPPHTAPAEGVGKGRTNRTVRLTVAVLFSAWLVDYADRLVINLVLPSLGEEFDLSLGQQGLVVSAFFLSYALCQIPGGMLADRFGARRVAFWALVAWSVFTALTGFAWSFAALLGVRFAFGVAEGVFPPAAMKLLTERTAPEERMGANGLVMSSNAVAAVLTPLVATPLIAAFGWRSAFFSTAALGILVVGAMGIWLPRPLARTGSEAQEARPLARTGSEDQKARSLARTASEDQEARSLARTESEAQEIRPLARTESEAQEARSRSRYRVRDVLRIGMLWRFALIMFGYNVIGWGLTTWVPAYLSEERGLPLAEAGPLLALPALGAAAATVIGGRISDRLEGNHRKVIVPAMAVAALALPLMAFSSSLVGFGIFGTLAVFSATLCYMPIFAVPLRALPPAYVGVGSAVIVFGGQVAGMVTPPVMGVIADAFSFEAAFLCLVLGAVLAAVMALFTPQASDAFRAALGTASPAPSSTITELS
ncbi:MFS transporter [Streptomyces diastatochromogenes]|nr:MFS transporter [Streptomyces diastatochromogenes]